MIKHSVIVLIHLLLPFSAYAMFGEEFSTKRLELLSAIRSGNTERVEKALQAKVPIHLLNSALIVAIENNKDAIVQKLIEAGADIHVDSENALCSAASCENLQIVKLLLVHGANPNAQLEDSLAQTSHVSLPNGGLGEPPLACVANALQNPPFDSEQHSHGFEIINELLKYDADTHAAYQHAYRGSQTKNAQSLTHQVLLRYLAFQKDYIAKKCEELKNKKYFRACNPEITYAPLYLWIILPPMRDHRNCSHQTPLIWACALGHNESVEALLACNLPKSYINARDSRGYTALMYAVKHNRGKIVHLLALNDLKEKNGKNVLTNDVQRYIEALIEAVKENHIVLATEILLFLAPLYGKLRSFDLISPATKK